MVPSKIVPYVGKRVKYRFVKSQFSDNERVYSELITARSGVETGKGRTLTSHLAFTQDHNL